MNFIINYFFLNALLLWFKNKKLEFVNKIKNEKLLLFKISFLIWLCGDINYLKIKNNKLYILKLFKTFHWIMHASKVNEK